MTRTQILTEAARIVANDRNQDYGTPEQNFERIAALWEAYTGYAFEPHDVGVMMILLKVARIKTSPGKSDHYVDIAGYAACAGELMESE